MKDRIAQYELSPCHAGELKNLLIGCYSRIKKSPRHMKVTTVKIYIYYSWQRIKISRWLKAYICYPFQTPALGRYRYIREIWGRNSFICTNEINNLLRSPRWRNSFWKLKQKNVNKDFILSLAAKVEEKLKPIKVISMEKSKF